MGVRASQTQIQEAPEKSKIIRVIFLDFSRTFDTVPRGDF